MLTEQARIAFANMRDYISIGPDGAARVQLATLTEDQWAAVSEVTVDTIGTCNAGDGSAPVVRTRLKLIPKVPVLDQLGRHLKLFNDKNGVEVSYSPAAAVGARLLHKLLDRMAHGKLDPDLEADLREIADLPPAPSIQVESRAQQLAWRDA